MPAVGVNVAREVRDGDILSEDDVLYRCERARWLSHYLQHSGGLIRQIIGGRTVAPQLTHCMVVTTKREQAS